MAGLLLGAPAGAQAADASTPTLLHDLASDYRQAAIAHDAALAARLRTEARLLAVAADTPATTRLARELAATRDTLRPWPVADAVQRLATRAGAAATAAPVPERPYAAIRGALGATVAAERSGDHRGAVAQGLRAYRLTAPLRRRLGSQADALGGGFWSLAPGRPGLLTALDRRAGPAQVTRAAGRARAGVAVAEQALGDVRVSRGTVVADAAIIVFREGLEAVLILAAITASFVGARRHLRRPVLAGGLAGIAATALTWLVAQLVVSEVGGGGRRLEAVTGLLAIAVLLVVTNWFFHHVYWSQWIARFNRRRKSLERLDRLGFVSGQAVALAVLGLTSVYREGFETVLFIQNLEVSAGTRGVPARRGHRADGHGRDRRADVRRAAPPAVPSDADRHGRADRRRPGGHDRYDRPRAPGARLGAEHAGRVRPAAVGQQLARALRHLGGRRSAGRGDRRRPRLLLRGPRGPGPPAPRRALRAAGTGDVERAGVRSG